MPRSIAVALVAWMAGVTAAWADGVIVYQDDKKFSDAEITIKHGQTITFTNKDKVTHNVFSNTPGMTFDLRTQRPGESSEVAFDKVGEAEVRCAIHPQMKMKVKVTE
jgi:plastocyanin